ncbi:MAG: hypothetical protein JL57_11155 [Desulfosporosinus sp. BICA1-9]|nr:MAG: hypothetical protein JL57_11155 [Desulfosporosinus sp. BICA1-9]
MQVKNHPQLARLSTSIDGAHKMCRLPSLSFFVPRFLFFVLPFFVLPFLVLPFLDPKPGTQYDTSATSLRKQTSKLPFKRPTPDTGQCTRMCTAANRAKDGEFGGDPALHSRSSNG